MSRELPSPPPPRLPVPEESREEPERGAVITEPPDLGRMGWRLGKKVLLKVADDKYGRRGTEARLLLRPATSLDILLERPNQWPKPPPGFSTKRVLGPHSDLRGKRKNKKQKKRSRGDEDQSIENKNFTKGPKTAESLLSAGLSAARAGFTVEEMEAERAKKRMKASER